MDFQTERGSSAILQSKWGVYRPGIVTFDVVIRELPVEVLKPAILAD